MKKKTAMLCLFGSLLISNVYCMDASTPEIGIDLERTYNFTPVEKSSSVNDAKAIEDDDCIKINTISPIGTVDPSTIVDKKNIPFDYQKEKELFRIFKSLATNVDKHLDQANTSMTIICALKEDVATEGISNSKQYYNKLLEKAKMNPDLNKSFISGLTYEINHLKFLIECDYNNEKTIKPVRFIENGKLDKHMFNVNRVSYRVKKAIGCIMQTIPSLLDSEIKLNNEMKDFVDDIKNTIKK